MRKLCLVLVLLVCLASAQSVAAASLLINQVSPYLGYGYGLGSWNGMSGSLNTSFGSGNITVSGSALSDLNFLMGFDRLWLQARQPGDPGLSTTELSNLSAFINSGRRVALIGENGAWNSWNNSILSAVGGAYSGPDTSGTLTPAISHPLTLGLTGISALADGIATGGTSVFNQNVVTLWGGNSNVVSVLSVNILDDSTGSAAGNVQFKANLADWLRKGDIFAPKDQAPSRLTPSAVPEPSSLVLLLVGSTGLFGAIRRTAARRNSKR